MFFKKLLKKFYMEFYTKFLTLKIWNTYGQFEKLEIPDSSWYIFGQSESLKPALNLGNFLNFKLIIIWYLIESCRIFYPLKEKSPQQQKIWDVVLFINSSTHGGANRV